MSYELIPLHTRILDLLDEKKIKKTELLRMISISRKVLYDRLLKPDTYKTDFEVQQIASALGISVSRLEGSDVVPIIRECEQFLDLEDYAELDNSLPVFRKAVQFLEISQGRTEQFEALNLLGKMYYKINRTKEALEYWFSALEIIKLSQDTIRLLICLNNICSVYVSLTRFQDLAKIIERYEGQILDCIDVRSYEFYGVLSQYSAIARYKMGDLTGAADYFEKAIAFLKIAKKNTRLATVYFDLAQYNFEQHNYEKALESINVCRDLMDQRLLLKMKTDVMLSKILFVLGREKESLDIINQSIECERGRNFKNVLAKLYLLRARITDSAEDASMVLQLQPNNDNYKKYASLIILRHETTLPKENIVIIEGALPNFLFEEWF